MNTEQSPARRGTTRRKLHRRLRGIAVLVLSFLLLLPFAGPVQALPEEQVRNEPVVVSDQTEIVFTSTGPGQRVNGALPPAGATWPVDAYPATIPGGYQTENVWFAGLLNT